MVDEELDQLQRETPRPVCVLIVCNNLKPAYTMTVVDDETSRYANTPLPAHGLRVWSLTTWMVVHRLWQLLTELSAQLSANKEHCDSLKRQCEQLKVRSIAYTTSFQSLIVLCSN